MAQWLKALTDSYRGPRHDFILSGDGNFGKKLHAWVVILGPRFLPRSLLPMKDLLSHTFLHDVLSKCVRPGSLSEIGNPHESPHVRYFPQIFDGQITPRPPALMIPCPLHSIMVQRHSASSRHRESRIQFLRFSFSFVSSCTSVEKQYSRLTEQHLLYSTPKNQTRDYA